MSATARHNRGVDACHVTQDRCVTAYTALTIQHAQHTMHGSHHVHALTLTHIVCISHMHTTPPHLLHHGISLVLVSISLWSFLVLVCPIVFIPVPVLPHHGSVSSCGGCYLILSFCWIFPSSSLVLFFRFVSSSFLFSSFLVLSNCELLC